MPRPYDEIDLSKVKTYYTALRQSKVTTSLEAVPLSTGINMGDFLSNLPAKRSAIGNEGFEEAVKQSYDT